MPQGGWVGGTVKGWTETPKLGRARERKIRLVTGIGIGQDFGVFNNSYVNVRRGLLERVLYRVEDGKSNPTPRPAGNFYERKLCVMRRAILAVTKTSRRMTRHEFVCCYVGRKRVVYEKACASLSTRPVSKADSYLSTFPKCEKLNFRAKPDPATRVIQPRGPRFNVELGRSLKRMEGALKEGLAEVWGGPTIMKGYNARDIGGHFKDIWSSFRDPVAIPIDAVRFDQHVSVDALKWEHSVYVGLTPKRQRKFLQFLLEMQLENRGFARMEEGDIEYTVEGRRMSGDMNTGMGNCLLMCSLFYAFLSELGIKGRLANNGDDCTLFIERRDLAKVQATLSAWFLDAGFVLTVEAPCYRLEDIEFCQTRPIEVSEGTYVMVRDPRTAIDKTLMTTQPLGSDKEMDRWAGAIGACELALGSGVPVWQEFALMFRRRSLEENLDEYYTRSGTSMLAKGMERKTQQVLPVARLSFWRAFNLTPDQQEAMERHFGSVVLTTSADDVADSPINSFVHII